jgi:DNA invertase Pin-like site-specific DNA recombinase
LDRPSLVDLLLSYLNRTELLHDLRETVRQLQRAASAYSTTTRSVKNVDRPGGSRRKVTSRLTVEQLQTLIDAFHAGTPRAELARSYGIGLTSVAKILREWRNGKQGRNTR